MYDRLEQRHPVSGWRLVFMPGIDQSEFSIVLTDQSQSREWIAPAVATFIVRELVEDYAEHPDYLDKINWYFLPSANPDGYQYSWEHDRLWRKTRSDHGSILGCKGVDPNRNWGFHWAESGSNEVKSKIEF